VAAPLAKKEAEHKRVIALENFMIVGRVSSDIKCVARILAGSGEI
jgi:hypothetical protein